MAKPESQERRNSRPIPIRRLSLQEIRGHIVGDNNHEVLYLPTNMLGLNVGGVNLLFVDINHESLFSDVLTQRLIQHPQTTGVFTEYFGHELELHGLYNQRNPLVRRYQKDRPFVQMRLKFAQQIADACKEARKPVFVADIANGPLYKIYDSLHNNPIAPVTGTIASLATGHPLLAIPFCAWMGNAIRRHVQDDHGVGMFNPERITSFERLLPDLEQARRLFVAKGIEQQVREMIASTPNEDKGMLIVLYPQAHSMRIMDMLEHPRKIADTARDLMYRGLAPFLEHAVRRYDVNEDGEWGPVKKRRIKILPRRPFLRPKKEIN